MNMKNEPFVIERLVNAPIKRVWEAITNKDLMKQWYFDVPDFRPEKGCKFQFQGGTEDKTYIHLCEVTEVVEGKKLKHSWRYDGYEGNSYVTWELFDEGASTRIKLTHEGLETFPANNPDFAKENFIQGWTAIVGTSIKEFVEAA
jgi:uncharacterized protein YndB with AHSA1/START domain